MSVEWSGLDWSLSAGDLGNDVMSVEWSVGYQLVFLLIVVLSPMWSIIFCCCLYMCWLDFGVFVGTSVG